MQIPHDIPAMDSSANEPHLSAEEIALFEEIVGDEFVLATVTQQDMRTAITDYAYRNWQA